MKFRTMEYDEVKRDGEEGWNTLKKDNEKACIPSYNNNK